MKWLLFLTCLCYTGNLASQNLQLHYDFRHSTDPDTYAKNYPSLSFEYFKLIDTNGTGSFLFKMQADLNGKNGNVGQIFTQISQTLRFWKPKVFLYLNYSGGIGVTGNGFGFYIPNAYGIGVSYPFQWKSAWFAANFSVRYNAFEKPSYDPQFTFYFGRGLSNWRFFTAGSFVFWTENKNHGDSPAMAGKKFAFFGDPQFWWNIKRGFSLGSRVNVLYNLISVNTLKIYPTIGIKYQF